MARRARHSVPTSFHVAPDQGSHPHRGPFAKQTASDFPGGLYVTDSGLGCSWSSELQITSMSHVCHHKGTEKYAVGDLLDLVLLGLLASGSMTLGAAGVSQLWDQDGAPKTRAAALVLWAPRQGQLLSHRRQGGLTATKPMVQVPWAGCPKQARCLRSRWGRSLHKGRQAGHEQPPLQRGGLLHTGAMSGHQQPSPVWVVPALKELALLPFLICQGRVTIKWAASSRRGRLGLGNTMVALLGKTWGVSDGPL